MSSIRNFLREHRQGFIFTQAAIKENDDALQYDALLWEVFGYCGDFTVTLSDNNPAFKGEKR